MRVPKRAKCSDVNVQNICSYHEITTTETWINASRAEKSRLAAKYRRDKEIEVLQELANLLPIPEEDLENLDKSAILRLAISFIELKQKSTKDIDIVLNEMKEEISRANNGGIRLNESQLMLDALDGFLIHVNKKGKIIYVSENVDKYLGEKQIDMIGENILFLIHHDDERELLRQFLPFLPSQLSQLRMLPGCMNSNNENTGICENVPEDNIFTERPPFYIRMRFHFISPGTKIKHSGYVLTQWSGRAKLKKCQSNLCNVDGLIAICKPLQSASVLEIRLDGNMFMSRHDLGMRFTFIDTRILTLVGYDPIELIGKTAYQFHNPLDVPKVSNCHSTLIVKGTSVSKYYRFLGKTGAWVWMQTRATIIYNSANEPQYVVCMNYVIGEDEGRRYLMLEQEEKGVHDPEIRGAIDVTSLSSPGPTNSTISSGYCSAEEDHSYSTTRQREPLTPESGILDFSLPHTPTTEGMALHLCNDTDMTNSFNALGDKISEFRTDDINLEELIDDWLDADSSSPVTTTSTTTLTQATLASTSTNNSVTQNLHWMTGFNPEFEMMDIDQGSIGGHGITDTSNESILMNLLKDSEKNSKGSPSMICEAESQLNGCTALDGGFGLTQAETTAANGSSSFLNTHKGLETKVTSSTQDPVLSAHFSTYKNRAPQSMNSKVTASATNFTSGMLGINSDAENCLTDNGQDFSLGLAGQQIGDVLANYLGEADPLPLTNFDTQTDDLNENPFTSVLNDTDFRIEPLSSLMSSISSSTYQSLSSSPSLSNGYFSVPDAGGSRSQANESAEPKRSAINLYPGLDDHRYSSRQESPTHTNNNKGKKGSRTVSSNRTEPSVLEKFLLTKQTLNPNKGSDAALAAQGISQLNIKDQQKAPGGGQQSEKNAQEDQANLLKKLLTGEMDKREVTKHEQRVIADRRVGVSSPPEPQSCLEPYPSLDTDDITYDTAQNIDLHLLGTDTPDMEKLWSPSSTENELMVPSELDEILREQLRQEDLWLQHYINELL